MIIGTWTLLFESEYNVLLGSSWFLIIVGLMIGTGGLIIIVSVCGCYGIVKEHRYFLTSVSTESCLPHNQYIPRDIALIHPINPCAHKMAILRRWSTITNYDLFIPVSFHSSK